MDLFDHGMSYQRDVMRRVFSSQLILNSVCAFTAKQLSRLKSGQVWEPVAARYYGESLRDLIHLLADPTACQDDALTATIMLSSYEIGSAITGAAPTMNVFLIGKIIAGIGSCGMYIGSVSYLSMMTSTKERPMYISLITPVWGLGTVLGPIVSALHTHLVHELNIIQVGGALAVSRATWRWGFYLNLVIGVVFAPIILFLLPAKDLQPNTSFKDKLKQNDFLGIVVWTGWNVAFAMAIDFGGIVFAWNSASEIALWTMVVVLMVVFVLTQKFHPFVTARNKLYPAHLLTNWKLVNLQWQTFAAVGIVQVRSCRASILKTWADRSQVPLYYIPLFFQFTQKASALRAAVCLLPFVFMIVISSLVSGQLMARLGYYMPWYVFAGATTLVGNALMCKSRNIHYRTSLNYITGTLTPSTSVSAIYGYSVLLGLGGGCTLLSAFAIAPALGAPEDEYGAIGCVGVAQPVGNVFFIATASNIFQNLGVAYVAPLVPPELNHNVRPLIAGTSSALFEKLSASVRDDVTAAIIQAMDKTYPLLAAASALCLILAPFMGVCYRFEDLFPYSYC